MLPHSCPLPLLPRYIVVATVPISDVIPCCYPLSLAIPVVVPCVLATPCSPIVPFISIVVLGMFESSNSHVVLGLHLGHRRLALGLPLDCVRAAFRTAFRAALRLRLGLLFGQSLGLPLDCV